jgi:putative oxidoreductase
MANTLQEPAIPAIFTDAAFPFAARLLISAIFFQGALGKIMGWSGQAAYMRSHSLPTSMIPTLLGIALAIEAVGVISLITGFQARLAAFIMFLYLGAVSVLLHNFWALPATQAGGMQTQFLKNIGIMGGLLMIAAYGPGRWCLRSGRWSPTLRSVSGTFSLAA